MFADIVAFLVESIGSMGYLGIILLMLLESSFFPFPSEVVMVPAGYLAFKGEMNIYLAVIAGVFGSLLGALINYYLALKFGRKFLFKYAKYFFINEEKFKKFEKFFQKHGNISTFNGRLIPGVRQYISFPAGLAKMNLASFAFYTSFGAGIWVLVLTLLGYFIGANQELIHEYIRYILYALVPILGIITIFYIKKKR